MRNMSFFLTTDQVRAKTKTVTRRLGWKNAKAGDVVQPVVKGQGLKKGETVQKIGGPIRFVSVTQEPLDRMRSEPEYGFAEVVKEGFDRRAMWPSDFIAMFCEHNRPCLPHWPVTRIEFEYLP